jgi:hypothetical protein
MPELTAWLVVSVLLTTSGLVALLAGRGRAGFLPGMVPCLAGSVLALTALVRFAVLPLDGLVVLLLALVLGLILMMAALVMAAGRSRP